MFSNRRINRCCIAGQYGRRVVTANQNNYDSNLIITGPYTKEIIFCANTVTLNVP